MDYIEALQKRYSVKKFDAEKKISSTTIQKILEAGKLSASSLGLQPYKIFVAETKEMKEKLIPAFVNPSQISTCSHLIIIVSKKTIDEDYINGYFQHISEVRNLPVENLEPFRNSINYYRNSKTLENTISWNEKQAYIVLGNLMFASALENVDTCPMEGFHDDIINEILELNLDKEHVCVTLALGYRAEDDAFQKMKKVRKPNEKLFKFL